MQSIDPSCIASNACPNRAVKNHVYSGNQVCTVYNDFSVEVPLEKEEECPLSAPNYKVPASIGLDADVMLTTPLLVDTGSSMNLVAFNFLSEGWKEQILPYDGRPIKSANKSAIDGIGKVRLCLEVGSLRVKVWFAVVRNLVTRILVGTPFIDNYIRGIHPPTRLIVPRASPPVHILAINDTDMDAIDPNDNASDCSNEECVAAVTELAAFQDTVDRRVRRSHSSTRPCLG